jgi:transposase InsO family protein
MERLSMKEKQNSCASDDEAQVLDEIKLVIDEQPTYGYRRVHAIVNHRRNSAGKDSVNHKRIYRLMREHKMLLPKYGRTKTSRTHTGKVMTLKSNTRWCSDGFTIVCDNGDQVYVAFSLDTCDREAMRYIASTKGIDGKMIRDLMLETMEYRFGGEKPNHAIQWLTDNGPAYIARETVAFGRQLGLDICTTPSYSPESNGMAEAFVKTFKRDYVWISDTRDAISVMEQLPAWFEAYNELAPHKGLKMLSPRQYIRQQMAG